MRRIMGTSLTRTMFMTSIAALAYVVSQPPLDLWPLAYICLVPWLWTISSLGSGLLTGSILGAFVGIGCGWWIAPSAAWLGSDRLGALASLLATAVWAKAIPFALCGAAIGALARAPIALRVIASAGVFSLVDTLHSIPPWGVPLALLGHSQWNQIGVAQLAAIGGVPLVSAFVAAVNAIVAELTRSRPTATAVVPAAAAAAASLGGMIAFGALALDPIGSSSAAGSIRVLAVQPAVPGEERWVPGYQGTNLAASIALADRQVAAASGADLVVLPEMVVTRPLEDLPALGDAIRGFARRHRLPVILGVARRTHSGAPERYRNSALAIDAAGELIGEMDKVVGVPIVESPRPGSAGLRRLLFGEAADGPKIEEAASAEPLRVASSSFAVALCYEILFPGVVAARRDTDTVAILNLASDSWTTSPAVARQQTAAAVFRAIEQALPVVRVSMGGDTLALDRYGRRLGGLSRGSWDALATEVAPAERSSGKPLRVGVVMLSGAVVGAILGRGVQRRKTMKWILRAAGALVLSIVPVQAVAEETTATLQLDGLSYVSFGGSENYSLPSGSSIRFRFGDRLGTSIPLTIAQADVSIAPIDLGEGATLSYGISGPASGSLRREDDGSLVLSFSATVVAALEGTDNNGSKTYPVLFTTESATARNLGGAIAAEMSGMRMVEGARSVQLVGAATNKENAFPAPGTGVMALLSGTFDRLPALR